MFNIFYSNNNGSGLNRGSDRPRRGRRNCNCYPKLPSGEPDLSATPIRLNDCLQFVPCPRCCQNRAGANYTGVDAIGRRYQYR